MSDKKSAIEQSRCISSSYECIKVFLITLHLMGNLFIKRKAFSDIHWYIRYFFGIL